MSEERRLVFISHANPEDNEFTLWLAARLTALGYLVWSDLTKLFGAEIFWADIEDAIRNHAIKVVVVLSRKSQEKDGVLDEVNLAVSIERKQALERFVVPLRIDDLPFLDVKPILGRKNIIDFAGGWPEGFDLLLKVLDRDGVPRHHVVSTKNTSAWIENTLSRSHQVVSEPQSLLSNWFEFAAVPEKLNFLMVPIASDKVRDRFESFTYPVYPYKNMLATFASEEDVNDFLPSWQRATIAYRIPMSALLEGHPPGLPQLKWNESSNMLSFLIRTAWDCSMRDRGLLLYEMANGRKTWFPVIGYSPDGWTRYHDPNGLERRKRLVGRSVKRKVFWHFAIEAWPSVGRELRIVLKPHVVFTEDGQTPISNASRMHQLRRGFCRKWWNPRWRDLLLAYAAIIVDESGVIRLPVGSRHAFLLNGRPMVFKSPVSVKFDSEPDKEEDETDRELDAMSGELPWEGGAEIGDEEAEEDAADEQEMDGSLS